MESNQRRELPSHIKQMEGQMLSKNWKNVLIQKPATLRGSADSIPLSNLYDSGFFVSAVFGSEAWVIDKRTFESQVLCFMSDTPDEMSKAMQSYNNKQYARFVAKQQRLVLRLLKHRYQIQS